MSAKLFGVGCHIWDQLACSLESLIYQCPSTCRINDTTVNRHQSFIEILNEQLIGYLMMRALNVQLLKSFPILGECLPIRLSNPTFSFLMLATRDSGKYFSRKIFFMPFQVLIKPRRIEKSHAFTALFKEKGKAFNLTYSSSTLFSFIPTQTIWNSLRWLWGSFLASPLNIGSKCIKPDLSSKLTLLSIFMYNG